MGMGRRVGDKRLRAAAVAVVGVGECWASASADGVVQPPRATASAASPATIPSAPAPILLE